MTVTATEERSTETTEHDYDVIIIGAGISGMYQLHLLKDSGLRVRVIEAGDEVGGVWFWNRYPGARLDSESYSYQYSFAKDLLEEWDWSEYFAGQPELFNYLTTVASRYDLRKDIDFDQRITTMTFDEETDGWKLETEQGRTYTSHVVIAAAGILSAPIYPRLPGMESFMGETFHTAMWPHEPVSFAGKKVAVIGTGSTGVQLIPEVAKEVGHLTVFQRTANWAVPLNNEPISDEKMAEIRGSYTEMFPYLQSTFSGFLHNWDPVPTTDYDDAGLVERFEQAYSGHGFSKWIGLPNDIAFDVEANKKWGEFLADKIRARVNDPATAEKLIPNDHYFGTKRVPCETKYYETYNRENVDLVSIKENPILEITETGIRTAEGDIDVDAIIYATGFEAFTGALKRIDIHGTAAETLKEIWDEEPVTYLGIQVAGFPNLFIMGGPHGKGGHGNGPRCAEKVLEWMAGFVEDIFSDGIRRVDADPVAQREWSDEVQQRAMGGLMAQTKSVFFGDNLEDEHDPSRKPRKRTYVAYIGALPEYVQRLNNLKQEGYPGFVITK